MEDYEIVALFYKRDDAAITEAARRYGAYCRQIAMNVLGCEEDAMECINDTWLGAWNSIPPHRPAVLSAYLGKLTRRIAMHRLQMQTAQKRGGGEYAAALEELAELLPDEDTVESALSEAELARFIDRFVRTLPERERRIFVSRYFAAEPIKSLAERFGMTRSGIKAVLSRTRKKLKKQLEEEDLW